MIIKDISHPDFLPVQKADDGTWIYLDLQQNEVGPFNTEDDAWVALGRFLMKAVEAMGINVDDLPEDPDTH